MGCGASKKGDKKGKKNKATTEESGGKDSDLHPVAPGSEGNDKEEGDTNTNSNTNEDGDDVNQEPHLGKAHGKHSRHETPSAFSDTASGEVPAVDNADVNTTDNDKRDDDDSKKESSEGDALLSTQSTLEPLSSSGSALPTSATLSRSRLIEELDGQDTARSIDLAKSPRDGDNETVDSFSVSSYLSERQKENAALDKAAEERREGEGPDEAMQGHLLGIDDDPQNQSDKSVIEHDLTRESDGSKLPRSVLAGKASAQMLPFHLQAPEDENYLGGDELEVPPGDSENDFICSRTFDFFNEINNIYSCVASLCTAESCPVMSAGPQFEYRWCDAVVYTQPVAMTAPEYIACMTSWVEEQLNDTTVFPVLKGMDFPEDFRVSAANIYRRLFRVYAHVYCQHFGDIVTAKAESTLKTSFTHFVRFALKFNLVTDRDLLPLKPLVDMVRTDPAKTNPKPPLNPL